MQPQPEQPGAPTGADAHYFGRLAQGVFEIPRCRDCMRLHFFPRVCCPFCGSETLEWVAPSGAGTVYSSTVVRRAEGDYTVCLIDLAEGPRLMSRVVGVPVEQVRIGMEVRAQVDPTDDGPLLVFAPWGDAS